MASEKWSTCHAARMFTNNIVENLNNHKYVSSVFINLAKAFDTVPIPILLTKLEGIGVRGAQLSFFSKAN